MRNLKRSLLVLPMLGALVAAPALAADKSAKAGAAEKPVRKEGSFGAGKTGAYLTREQLRSCLSQRDKMKTDDAELRKDEVAMTGRKAEIVRSGDELKARVEGLDRTDAGAVTAYNEAVRARDEQIDDFQSSATAFNARVNAKVAAHADFDQSCGNRRYFDEDESAIRNGR